MFFLVFMHMEIQMQKYRDKQGECIYRLGLHTNYRQEKR